VMTKFEEIGVAAVVVLGLAGLYFYLKGPSGPIAIPSVATGALGLSAPMGSHKACKPRSVACAHKTSRHRRRVRLSRRDPDAGTSSCFRPSRSLSTRKENDPWTSTQ
jgi:hypothetical protein